MIEIKFLADHPKTIPILVSWFRDEWPDYYGGRTLEDIAQDFQAEANRTGLPVRLVAFSDGDIAGTVTLREQALQAFPNFHPGLGGLFVVGPQRSQGIGSELVRAVMHLAAEQGWTDVYAATVAAAGLLERLGWQRHQVIWHHDEELSIYRCDL